MSAKIALRRLEAGLYRIVGTEFGIVRTDSHEGPRGGRYFLWELARITPSGSIEILTPARSSLRAMRRWVAEHPESVVL